MTPFLIEISRIKEYGIIDSNVDDKLIGPTIIMVQDIWLQQLIGTDLYQQICGQVASGTVSAANKTLLDDYIENLLHAAVVSEGLITFNYRISNKAVVTSNSDNQFPVGNAEIERIEKKWRSNAEFYGKRLTDFLCEHSSEYPLYRNSNIESDKIRPKSQRYSSGMFLGNTRCQNRIYCSFCRGICNGNCYGR
jgi:hypothetical protein